MVNPHTFVLHAQNGKMCDGSLLSKCVDIQVTFHAAFVWQQRVMAHDISACAADLYQRLQLSMQHSPLSGG